MKKLLLSLCLIIFGATMVVDDAEARRMGGGRSLGMQRQATPPAAAPKNTQNAANPTQQAGAAATPKRSWAGPLAGLAAGLGLAALASYLGFGEGLANIMMIALLVMAAVVAYRLFFRKKNPAQEAPLQYAGAGHTPAGSSAANPLSAPSSFNQASGGTAAAQAPAATADIPADFDVSGFLRVAKVNFVRLQAAYDAGNLNDIREFTSPEVFAEIKLDMDQRPAGSTQQTDVVTLEADLTELTTEAGRHIASVRFHGMIREEQEGAAQPFDEIWHLTKPVNGSQGWIIAGIQQVQ